jgi:hypothetical protein
MEDNSLVLKESVIGLIKGAIGAIPFCGSAINEALFDIAGRIQQKRINEFVVQLTSQINEIADNKIDEEYLKSEDFYDLTRIIFESVIRIKSKEKQTALSRVYLNAIQDKSDIEQDLSILFSKFIIELVPLQIKILFFIEQKEAELIEIGSYKKFYDLFILSFNITELDKYEFKYACNDLENKTLISLGAGLDDFDSTIELISTEGSKEASIKLTTIGIRFLELLK